MIELAQNAIQLVVFSVMTWSPTAERFYIRQEVVPIHVCRQRVAMLEATGAKAAAWCNGNGETMEIDPLKAQG